jgi:hypothetical protein
MRLAGVPAFRYSVSVTVAGLSKGCTACNSRTRIVECISNGGLYAFILCLCCQRYCDESISNLRIPTKPLQTRFRNLDDGEYWVIFASSATRYIIIRVEPLL